MKLFQYAIEAYIRTTTRIAPKLLVRKCFREGDVENEMICQICPGRRVIRRHHAAPLSNLVRHVKRFHPNELKMLVKDQLCSVK